MSRMIPMRNAIETASPMSPAMNHGHTESEASGTSRSRIVATDHMTKAATALLAMRSARKPTPARKDFTAASIAKVIHAQFLD